ncbi:MAG: hypothetical protein J7L73_00875 [Anaerolineales bacterium]|nr:hypothetical protein [Anaerolineales bacterium]
MLKKFVQILGGNPDKKTIEGFKKYVNQINALEPQFEALSNEEIHAATDKFRIRLAKGETLDELLPETFAIVREASKRTIGLRHFDVQLIGGIAMHRGIIAEMKTGEGKTLVATLPLYLNALVLNDAWVEKAREIYGENPENWTFSPINELPVGRGVHLVTVNDYLARRDARWMAPIYDLLGLSIGVLQMAARTEHGKKGYLVDLNKKSPHEDQNQLQMVSRKKAYAADVTYGTNNEFGFDYLRDNMTMNLEDRVQRGHFFAIIDEVDNVLIDEARTPLIISGPSQEDTEWYSRMAQVVRQLKPEDYEISERDRTVTLTEIGETHVEQVLGIALRDPERPEDVTPEQARLLGYLEQALRSEFLYKRNKEYIVQAGKVIIVDEFTGRLMPGRRWSDGLHQAVEAKEGVRVQSENVTYATITIQNYFRMYEKLAGMTGTAVTEAEEFNEIYSLDAIAIPTNLDYLASSENSPIISLEGRDESGYKFTYYIDPNDPERKPIYWKRKDYPDVIYRTLEAKLRAIVREILTHHVLGRPILVGTTSVELSEIVSRRLRSEAVRRLIQVILIRDAWFTKNNSTEDGRQINDLIPLNVQLDKMRPSEMRRLIKDLDLKISLNPEDEQNTNRLLELLGLQPSLKERLVKVLKGGIPHQVLNARKHTEESQIIAGAGAFGAVTIATNMAGRGVDIKLGGELAEEVLATVNRVLRRTGYDDPYDMSLIEKRKALLDLDPSEFRIYDTEIKFFLRYMDEMERVKKLGGLHVIGSERHEARRIDNQLRGRSARQGDPGSSRFFLSLEDNLLMRFGGQQLEGLLSRLRVDDQLPIENALVSRIVEQSQTRVEGANFDVRKHLLEYDDVLNTQRAKIYSQRDRIFLKDDLSEDIQEMLIEEVQQRVPEALEDEEGPWKLLSWLEQIQPSAPIGDTILPSYTLKLLVEDLLSKQPTLPLDQALTALVDIATQAIRAEGEHLVKVVATMLDQNIDRLGEQLEERLDNLDTFFDALSYADETDTRGPRELVQEIQNLVRLPIKLTQTQANALREDPDDVQEVIRKQIEQMMIGITITRLIGAVERVLREPLGFTRIDLAENDWDSLANQVLNAIDNIFDKRLERFIGNGTPGQIVKDLEINLEKIKRESLTEEDLLFLLTIIPQGRRSIFDKKTHQRVWQRTTRMTYIYLAAKKLSGREPEEVTQDVLAHLENAQNAIREAWGEAEFSRLTNARLIDLDPKTIDSLKKSLSENEINKFSNATLQSLPQELQDKIRAQLGRITLTNIFRQLLLRVISELWVEYLTRMEALRVSIGLEAYAQRDPLVQYKSRAFEMFQNLLHDMRMSVVTRMFTFQPHDISTVQSGVSRSVADIKQPEKQIQQPTATKGKRRRRRKR